MKDQELQEIREALSSIVLRLQAVEKRLRNRDEQRLGQLDESVERDRLARAISEVKSDEYDVQA